ncbi:helix-turn-helix domain-containing protein [Nonomuraea cavernae]|uniref:HTH cro/C1-type domain-containing protein n=1 Tax=Nonomuraea cavernae TaxID=2045107 RepID=A0A918DJW3_9ACTN|nr:helix-turn-helix transcriptional regulator [Nonomuraea cavernae]MCA2187678.1 helix-turn-helix transcriptional regulator [Nonomuraea cavernae]GGO70836.1 hypothetical protein GCM10012289_35160 [Nonomuraea cavernae]
MGITRSRRAQIQREATTIRMRAQRAGHTTERIVTELRNALPELTALEAWRLALGWSRAQVVEQVAAAYFGEGLRPPGLSEARLCRMEHGQERPGPEYAEMLARAYGTSQETLGLMSRCVCGRDRRGYGQLGCWTPLLLPGVDMTSASGLPAVRESLRLALLDAPQGDPAVVELVEVAVEHYALNYSRHAPSHLFDEVHASRRMLAEALAAPGGDGIHRDLRRATGWLSGLLGNLAYHLADQSGARAHLALAASLGERVGDTRLVAWTLGAQSMLARARHDLPSGSSTARPGWSAPRPRWCELNCWGGRYCPPSHVSAARRRRNALSERRPRPSARARRSRAGSGSTSPS